MRRLLNKVYKSDSTHLLSAHSTEIIHPSIPEAVEAREITRAELIEYVKDPKYTQLKESSIEGTGENYNKHAFGTFVNGILTGYNFHTVGRVDPSDNTGGYPFGGIGFELPENVVYLFNGFALPEYRGQGHTGIAIAVGINELIDSSGWAIATTATDNASSIRMCEKLGLKKHHILKETRVFGKGIYSFPEEITLGSSDDINYKRISVFK